MKYRNSIVVALGFVLALTGSVAMAADDAVASVALLKEKLLAKGAPKIDGTYKLAGKEIMNLKFGSMAVSKNENAIVDSVKAKLGGVCTIFILTADGKDFIRASTNVLDSDPAKKGQRCMGTLLTNPGPVYDAIAKQDKDYTGEAVICGINYNTYYERIKADGKTVGIYLCGYKKE